MAEEAVEDSILNMTKKVLGLAPDYDEFDLDIMMHINSVFVTLQQIGAGPLQGFQITGPDEKFSDFTGSNALLNNIRSYVYLRVKMMFDITSDTSYVIQARERQITELEYRINLMVENLEDEAESEIPV